MLRKLIFQGHDLSARKAPLNVNVSRPSCGFIVNEIKCKSMRLKRFQFQASPYNIYLGRLYEIFALKKEHTINIAYK